jgi:hypothetical protein
MFEQFRTYFPQGSLISELIQIDHGKYIVRASVQSEGLTLATGLAAADTVEQAEDKARTRALAVLDIAISPTKSPSVPSAKGKQAPAPVTPPQNQSSESSATETLTSTVNIQEEKALSSQRATASPNGVTNSADHASVSSSEGAAASPTIKTDAKTETDYSEAKQRDAVSNQFKKQSESSHTSEEAIMDNSDVIARTNVELRRLNWTSEQGRKFLEEAYGKRSRSLLSEAELLEFLQYLEQQPTPTSESE